MGKKIMVVDDDPSVRITIKEGLENLSQEYEVISIENGEQCFNCLKNNQLPDLILLDIMMPDMDGWQVLNRLRDNNEWSKIPIVFLTAKTDDFSKTFGKTVSEDYIEKPFIMSDLKQRIDMVLKKSDQEYSNLV